MADWFLVRHGETQWNAERRVQGQTDVPMHEHGKEQIARTAARLADVPFDAVYASDLVRARETAEIIIAASLTGPHELRLDSALREIAFGEFEGMTWPEIVNVGRSEAIEDSRDLDYHPSGGESYRELMDRSGVFADTLRRSHVDADVLVVGHGGALRALAVRLLGLPYEAYWLLGGLGSGSISKVRTRNDGAALAAWNDVGHMQPSQRLG